MVPVIPVIQITAIYISVALPAQARLALLP
jgi:hypothetical protein